MFVFLLFWMGMSCYCLLFSLKFVKSVKQIKTIDIMITTEQENLIRRYLLDKKLTLDVAAEVYDHMLTQVTVRMSEGESFDVAWQKLKLHGMMK